MFLREVLETAGSSCTSYVSGFRNFVTNLRLEKTRTEEEYLFEFLMIGVLWKEYSNAALSLSYTSFKILNKLVELRQKYKLIKKYIDVLRGVLSTALLYRSLNTTKIFASPSLKNFSLLIKWLNATGEFKEEVKRLDNWRLYLDVSPKANPETLLKESIKFAQWFEGRSEEVFGKYTANNENFHKNELQKHIWKEDIIFCARTRLEYHMNMIGAEIMNTAFEKDFNQTEQRAVLVPACMRLLPDKNPEHPKAVCKANRKGIDYICTDCSPNCRVHKLNEQGEQENFKVFIIPHSSDFSQWLKEHSVNHRVGTIGIACINNLISGGLELKSLDIPAQCVLLDYCGCKNHWDKAGFPTDINIERLNTIMKNELSKEVHSA